MMGGRLLSDYTPERDGYYRNLSGAGVESMSAKWDEMFGEKKEEVAEEVNIKKPRKKTVVKKKVEN